MDAPTVAPDEPGSLSAADVTAFQDMVTPTPAPAAATAAPAPAASSSGSSSGFLGLLLKLFPSITSGAANLTLIVIGIILLVGVLLHSAENSPTVVNAVKDAAVA